MEILLFVGLGSLLLGTVPLYLALRSKDSRTVAIVLSLTIAGVLLFASLYMDYHWSKATLEHQYQLEKAIKDRSRVDVLLEGIRQRQELEAHEDIYETGADDIACKRTQNLREAQSIIESLGLSEPISDSGWASWGGYFRVDPPGRDIIICYYRWSSTPETPN